MNAIKIRTRAGQSRSKAEIGSVVGRAGINRRKLLRRNGIACYDISMRNPADPIRPWRADAKPIETYCGYLRRASDPVRAWLRAEAAHGTAEENAADDAEELATAR